jgi:hypothetical protein
MFREAVAPARPAAALDGQAACFDHAGKRAVAACNQCGRFVCDLCKVDFGGQVWCPSCVSAGSGAARAAHPDSSRVLYDSHRSRRAHSVPDLLLAHHHAHRSRHTGFRAGQMETAAQPGPPQPVAIRSGHRDFAGRAYRLAVAAGLLGTTTEVGALSAPVDQQDLVFLEDRSLTVAARIGGLNMEPASVQPSTPYRKLPGRLHGIGYGSSVWMAPTICYW